MFRVSRVRVILSETKKRSSPPEGAKGNLAECPGQVPTRDCLNGDLKVISALRFVGMIETFDKSFNVNLSTLIVPPSPLLNPSIPQPYRAVCGGGKGLVVGDDDEGLPQLATQVEEEPVSYTHLTLPTMAVV